MILDPHVPRTTGALLGIVVTMLAARVSAETISEMQWYLRTLSVPEAHKITRGEGVIVAVIDSGVDASHPDLAGAVLPGGAFLGSTEVGGRSDSVGHGTKMAGVIAARGGGPNRALGIAPRAKILPIALPTRSTYIGSVAEPIRWAVDHGAQVINLSVGRPRGEALPAGEADAVAYALAKNVVVVVSAGNVKDFPTGSSLTALPGVVAVSGTARDGSFWSGSAQGSFVALAAPGANIVNVGARSVHKTGYSQGSGTSESSAIVSGVAALIRARYPELDAANVINRLLMSAVDKGASGRDPLYGFGSVDAYRALTMDIPRVSANPLGVAREKPAAVSTPAPADEDFGTPAIRLGIVVGIVVVVGLLGAGFVLALILLIAYAAKPRRP